MVMRIFLLLAFTCSVRSFAQDSDGFVKPAQNKPSAPAAKAPSGKSRLNTNIYEKEASANQKSFVTTVKMIREVQGSWEVMFDKPPGTFSVPDSMQSMLVEAKKSKTAVMVKVDTESNTILSVQWGPPGSGQNPLGK